MQIVTILLIKYIALTVVWFIHSAAISGFLFIYLNKTYISRRSPSRILFWIFFIAYWCIATALYFGSLYLYASQTSPYNEISTFLIIAVGASPLPVSALIAIWLIRKMKIGW